MSNLNILKADIEQLEKHRATAQEKSNNARELDHDIAIELHKYLNDIDETLKIKHEEYRVAQIEIEISNHPLIRFVQLASRPAAPDWVVPNFIAEGVVVIAGGHGVGKTTTVLPLGMAVAGVHDKDYELAPKHWRHVVYITEDVSQAQRIITGYGDHLAWPGNKPEIFDNINNRLHIVEAQRMKAGMLVRAGAYYREKLTRTIRTTDSDGNPYVTELLPLIIIDTMAATIELENENDNSEASQAIAAIKQRFEGLPTWIVGHVAKASLGRETAVTLRGAGAFEADANQVLYIVQEEKGTGRWLTRGKTRFESPWADLEIKSDQRVIKVKNRFGEDEEIVLRWAVATPPDDSRSERAEKAKDEKEQREADHLRAKILTNAAERYLAGMPLNKTGLRDIVGGSTQAAASAIAGLIADGWLHEIEVPREDRIKNKPSFLIALDEAERAEFLETGAIPSAKQYIPPSWKKQEENAEE